MEEANQLATQQQKIGKSILSIINDAKLAKTRTQTTNLLTTLEQLWCEASDNDRQIHALNLSDVNYITTNYFAQLQRKYQEAKAVLTTSTSNVTSITTAPSKSLLKKRNNRMKYLETDMSVCDNCKSTNPEQFDSVYWSTKLSQKWEEIVEIHHEICDGDDDIDDTDFVAHHKIIAAYLANLKICPKSNEPVVVPQTTPPSPPPPKLPTTSYEGGFKEWIEFQDLFKRLVHNHAYPKSEKLEYLKLCVRGEPLKLINQLAIIDSNYEIAWKILEDRYNNPRQLLAEIIDRLIDQPTCTSVSSNMLKELHDTTNECLEVIKNMNIDTSSWGPIVGRIVMRKWDPQTKEKFESELANPYEIIDLDEILTFLQKRFRSVALCEKPVPQAAFSSSNNSCNYCHGNHQTYKCFKLQGMNVHERNKVVRTHRLCINCLGKHGGRCNAATGCKRCNGYHHTLLHIENKGYPQHLGKKSYTTASNKKDEENLLLATALVNIATIHGGMYAARVLVDPGSEISLITENAVQQIGLSKKAMRAEVSGLGDETPKIAKCKVDVQLYPRFTNSWTLNTELFVLSKLTDALPSQPLKYNSFQHWQSRMLADPLFYRPGSIDILLGVADVVQILLSGVEKDNGYMAQNSQLGWLISGGQRKINDAQPIKLNSFVQKCQHIEDLSRFWELEEINLPPAKCSDDIICEEIYKTTTTRSSDGRYTVCLPFKESPPKLGESKVRAAARQIQLEKRFMKDAALKIGYHDFIKEYLKLGHMRPAQTNSSGDEYYIPHHAVIKETSSTTKLRVVFDASCKTTLNTSLNDNMYVGCQLQNDITDLLLRWRRHKIGFTADIEKMYRQIRVAEEHHKYQKILWRFNPQATMKEFELTTVTYGTASAPYLAIRTLNQLADDEEANFPDIAGIIRTDFYVDDVLSGTNDIESAIKLQRDLLKVMEKGGFKLRKWSSNHSDLIANLPEELIDQTAYDLGSSEIKKTLGIAWDPIDDTFRFNINMNTSTKVTKRIILSEISKIFDPLGWLAPVIIKVKLQIQQLWMEKVDWDVQLSTEHKLQWQTFCTQLTAVKEIKMGRWLATTEAMELHGFCDASEKAYGAVVYSKTVYEGKVHIKILQAKSKVAPIKIKTTLPRLELCAATLLAKLLKKVAISLMVPINLTFAWSDSTITLAWIKGSPTKRETFVANRIAIINENIPGIRWNHVRTHENPADLVSRGVDPSKITNNELWWNGPTWLKENEINWPPQPVIIGTPIMEEIKAKVHAVSIRRCTIIEKFSTLNHMLRVLSYCRRFRIGRKVGPLQYEEVEKTLKMIIKTTQEENFKEEWKALSLGKDIEKSSRIKSLSPVLDNEGIMRVGGRLDKAELRYNQRHPMLIPPGHHLAKLILHEAHHTTLHGGVEATLAYARRKFWIPKAKVSIRTIINHCTVCIRHKAQTTHQVMGQLPKARVTPSRPFTHTGVDYAGPINVRISKGRGNKSYKGYIAIFICLATRAIHIEVVSDLTSNTFLAAFRRFTSRRGNCLHMYSDNGTTFVGAAKQLKADINKIEQSEEVQGATTKYGTTWHFIPALSPHFGGLWEAGVKSIKYHLKRQIGDSTLTYEELTTLLHQIEASLNSRPICSLNNDNDELEILTAGHFLVGGPIIEPPNPIGNQINTSLAERWQLMQRMKKGFWKAWTSEYLSRLQHQYKWTDTTENLKVGTVVIMKEKDVNPAKWPLAKITETHPGEDGNVRVVTLRGHNGRAFKRALTNLIPLPEESIIREGGTQIARINHTVTAQFTIENITSGVYVEHLGTAYVNRGQFRMQVLYDKEKISQGIRTAQQIEEHFLDMCNISTSYNRSLDCAALHHHLAAQTKKLEWVKHDLHLLQTVVRNRRGLLGTILTSVFGVNDEVYRDIDALTENQKELIKTSHRQSEVMLSTLYTLNISQHRMDYQLVKYQTQMSHAMRLITSSTAFFAQMMSMYQEGINYISEITYQYGKLTKIGVNRGSFFEIVSPAQVASAIKEASALLGTERRIRSEMLIKTEMKQNRSHLIIYGHFPIVDTTGYTLMKLTATPINITENIYTVFEMPDQITAVNYNLRQLFELSPEDFKGCFTFGGHTYACSPGAIRKMDTTSNCIIESIYGNVEPCRHNIVTHKLSHLIWKQLLMPNTWLFITKQPTTIAVICHADRINALLVSTGILKLNNDCRVDSKQHILLANRFTTIDVVGAYVHPISLRWNQSYQPYLSTAKEIVYRHSEGFKEIIEAEQNIVHDQNETVWHTVYQHSVITKATILILVIIAIIIASFFIYRLKRMAMMRGREQPPPPASIEMETL